MAAKHFINDGSRLVQDALSGLVLANPSLRYDEDIKGSNISAMTPAWMNANRELQQSSTPGTMVTKTSPSSLAVELAMNRPS